MKNKILAILLVLAMCLGMLPMSVFAADTAPSYVALGDSISTGYGLANKPAQGFTYIMANDLGYTLTNLAVDGNTAAGILTQLQQQSYKDAVAGADLITITAGGNDLMAVLYQAIADLYNATQSNEANWISPSDVTTIMADTSDGRRLNVLNYAMGLLNSTSDIYLLDDPKFTNAITDYITTLTQVVSTIRALNGNATIIVATQYNPYVEYNGASLVFFIPIDLTPIYSGMEAGVTALNNEIKSNARSGGYIVADVKAAFDQAHSETNDLYVADPESLEFDFHPNAAGHAVLADTMKAAVPRIIEDPDASVTFGGYTTYHETLDEAIQEVKDCTAEDKAVVTILKDIELGDSTQAISSGVFTIDLNGFEISSTRRYFEAFSISNVATNVTIQDSGENGKIIGDYAGIGMDKATLTVLGGTISGDNGVYAMNNSTMTISGGTIRSNGTGIYAIDSTVTISGGSISDDWYDIYSSNSSITLSLGDNGEGATFPGGIKVKTTLNEILGSGAAYWQDGKLLSVTDDQTVITGGDVVIKAHCVHTDTMTCTDNKDGATHKKVCSFCGYVESESEAHSFGNTARCVCGAVDIANCAIRARSSTDVVTGYITWAEAMADTTEGITYYMLMDNVSGGTITRDILLDLNGYDLTDVTIAEGVTLYGMDSTTDDYDCTDGYGTISGTVNGTIATNIKTTAAQTGAIKRYLTVTEDGKTSFHRFYMGITHMSLCPNVTGVGYKALFCGDSVVKQQVEAYGFNLWVTDSNKQSVSKTELESGETVTLRLENFDVMNYGEADVYATVFMQFENGVKVESVTYSYTLRSLLESINDAADGFTALQMSALQNMCRKYEQAMAGWDIANILDGTSSETA